MALDLLAAAAADIDTPDRVADHADPHLRRSRSSPLRAAILTARAKGEMEGARAAPAVSGRRASVHERVDRAVVGVASGRRGGHARRGPGVGRPRVEAVAVVAVAAAATTTSELRTGRGFMLSRPAAAAPVLVESQQEDAAFVEGEERQRFQQRSDGIDPGEDAAQHRETDDRITPVTAQGGGAQE